MMRARGTKIPFPGIVSMDMAVAARSQRLRDSGLTWDGDFPRAALYPGGSDGIAPPTD